MARFAAMKVSCGKNNQDVKKIMWILRAEGKEGNYEKQKLDTAKRLDDI